MGRFEPAVQCRQVKGSLSPDSSTTAFELQDVIARLLSLILMKGGCCGGVHAGCMAFSLPSSSVSCRLEGHGHYVNTMSLNTDHVLRMGVFDSAGQAPETSGKRELNMKTKECSYDCTIPSVAAKAGAQARFDAVCNGCCERYAAKYLSYTARAQSKLIYLSKGW